MKCTASAALVMERRAHGGGCQRCRSSLPDPLVVEVGDVVLVRIAYGSDGPTVRERRSEGNGSRQCSGDSMAGCARRGVRKMPRWQRSPHTAKSAEHGAHCAFRDCRLGDGYRGAHGWAPRWSRGALVGLSDRTRCVWDDGARPKWAPESCWNGESGS